MIHHKNFKLAFHASRNIYIHFYFLFLLHSTQDFKLISFLFKFCSNTYAKVLDVFQISFWIITYVKYFSLLRVLKNILHFAGREIMKMLCIYAKYSIIIIVINKYPQFKNGLIWGLFSIRKWVRLKILLIWV